MTEKTKAELIKSLLEPLSAPLNDPDYWDVSEWQYAWTDEKRAELSERMDRAIAGDKTAFYGWKHPKRIFPYPRRQTASKPSITHEARRIPRDDL